MEEVIPGLWIGDLNASQNFTELRKKGIFNLVSAMKQKYEPPTEFTVYRVLVDDVATANLISSFDSTNHFIKSVLEKGEKVLVHCFAGQSRSSTLIAAYLMSEKIGMETGEAIAIIKRARSQIEPSRTFMDQLEMYERSQCEWNPSKWTEQRRFLMDGMATQVLDGAEPAILLAYYPSPAITPRMSPTQGAFPDVTSPVASTSTLPRKRLTERDEGRNTVEKNLVSIENVGVKGEVVITGRRIRCRMCRRELAGREHILDHETGKGQHAFAPRRRDMSAYRAEQEKFRVDQKAEELRQTIEDRAAYQSADALLNANLSTSPKMPPPHLPAVESASPINAIAGLRISVPRIAVPGLRMAVPRPRAPLPTPNSIAAAAAAQSQSQSTLPISPPVVEVPISPLSLPTTEVKEVEPPLLPSHLCSSYFVEPMSWMSKALNEGALAGKLFCPNDKCLAKLGNFDWAGSQCSCGAWICPGFAIGVAKVDEIA